MRYLLASHTHHFWGPAILATVVFGVLAAFGPMCALGQTPPPVPTPAVNPDRLPITTSSPEAAKLFEEGLRLSSDLHTEQALAKLREATRKDPNFTQAWVYILWTTSDPVEEKAAVEKALLTSQNATPGEKLLVKWLTSVEGGHFVDAITAMNDLLAMYPRDTELNFEAEVWLDGQREYEAAAKFGKRALAVDPNFVAVLNEIGYSFAGMRQYDQAIPYLKRYVDLEPGEPNTRDSLAEILQKAGRLEDSLAEYREALKLDPKYYTSQMGLGNDYALLGKQDRAREEYAKALPMASTPQDKLDCEIQSAITYAREGNTKQVRLELSAVLDEAAKLQLTEYRSYIHQELALLADSPAAALRELDEAEAVLREPGPLSPAARNAALGRTLVFRARIAAEAGNLEIARAAVARLQQMLQENHSYGNERCYHGANGALLAAEKKTVAAIEELQQVPDEPFSMAKLAELQAAAGYTRDAAETRARLQADYRPSLGDWLVVRKFRP
jgi:tetratricopeptide (TPR) repeat protein